MASPITELTRKNQRFHWGPQQQEAFETIKTHLLQEPVLTFPNYDKDFHIFTDSSTVAIAGALMQVHLNQIKKYVNLEGPARTLPAITEEEHSNLRDAHEEQINLPGYSYESSTVPVDQQIPLQHKYNLRPR
ncbi:unnamed protein product [Anisakis simplex]|uniref:RT_RNaseH_2 domain-containing protein n=1 Tax=Anisakis simplex TaxID=6269 RepID=A0A158PMT0_ANISI|nr:unnamed protein product [Anisakis simplex]